MALINLLPAGVFDRGGGRRCAARVGRRREPSTNSSRTRRCGSPTATDAPPFSFTDAIGEPAGFMVDLCRSVAKNLATAAQSRRSQGGLCPRHRRQSFRCDRNRKGGPPVRTDLGHLVASRAGRLFDRHVRRRSEPAGEPARAQASLAPWRARRSACWPAPRPSRACATPLPAPRSMRRSFPPKPTKRGSRCSTKGRSRLISAIGPSSPISPPRAARQASCASPTIIFSLEPYALALAHGDSDFRLAVDRALSRIYRSGEIGAIFAHSFGSQTQPSDTLKTLYLISALPE